MRTESLDIRVVPACQLLYHKWQSNTAKASSHLAQFLGSLHQTNHKLLNALHHTNHILCVALHRTNHSAILLILF